MGLWHWFTGTEPAAPNTPRKSAAQLRQALLGLNSDDIAWSIAPDPHDDDVLVARWKYFDPRWHHELNAALLEQSFHTLVFLDDKHTTVRSVDLQISAGVFQGAQEAALEIHAFRGQAHEVGKHIEFGRKPDGKFGILSSTSFHSMEFKNAMKDVALACGWGWRGVAFGRLKVSQR